ncbi:hypothetical protein TNCV_3717901 [Trichonephila clavipes]|nr:hypothetical protein TNCV_1619311 [Trichonephila clavipes]GFX85620.1 hypothetical protein TNCV_3717901 [Trichonephila clavipes]
MSTSSAWSPKQGFVEECPNILRYATGFEPLKCGGVHYAPDWKTITLGEYSHSEESGGPYPKMKIFASPCNYG